LRKANFVEADLSGAKLSWVNMAGAQVSLAQLEQAADLTGLILPDGSMYES
jgi:uncharacterized protein YjbI with pentapeptide repeats